MLWVLFFWMVVAVIWPSVWTVAILLWAMYLAATCAE
jgi:hypothetical protein